MQPLTAGTRSALTAAAVTALIRDSAAPSVAAGCELLDRGLNVLADITEVLVAGSVSRQSYADLHGSATLQFEGTLDWGTAIVRPYMVLSTPTTTARFNLGAYYTSTPKTELGDFPVVYTVPGVDILDGLNTPVGEVYGVAAGDTYLSTVERILIAQGLPAYQIDQQAAAVVLPSPRVWALDEQTTWLHVVNDLLSSIGYMGIWSDWDGQLRVQPYTALTVRPPEWVYDVDPYTSMVTVGRSLERDFYRAPNRWTFWRSNNVDGAAPVEGDGIYTYINTSTGPTSVEARGGRVISRPVPLDVADQASLVAAAQLIIDADLRLKTSLALGTAPNPLHWHMDRVAYTDPAIGPAAQVVVAKWTLPLDGGDMSHEWSLV